MKILLKLTSTKGQTILIGTESIISVENFIITDTQGNKTACTKIDSRGAMLERFYVTESVEQIYEQYENN
jgi:hypothetical protein